MNLASIRRRLPRRSPHAPQRRHWRAGQRKEQLSYTIAKSLLNSGLREEGLNEIGGPVGRCGADAKAGCLATLVTASAKTHVVLPAKVKQSAARIAADAFPMKNVAQINVSFGRDAAKTSVLAQVNVATTVEKGLVATASVSAQMNAVRTVEKGLAATASVSAQMIAAIVMAHVVLVEFASQNVAQKTLAADPPTLAVDPPTLVVRTPRCAIPATRARLVPVRMENTFVRTCVSAKACAAVPRTAVWTRMALVAMVVARDNPELVARKAVHVLGRQVVDNMVRA